VISRAGCLRIVDNYRKYDDAEAETEEELARLRKLAYMPNGLEVTDSGLRALGEILGAEFGDMLEERDRRIARLVECQLYDTSLREVGVVLEEELRRVVGGSDAYGTRLVDEVMAAIKTYKVSYTRTLGARLRTFIALVRNLYAHRLIAVSEVQCRATIVTAFHLISEVRGLKLSAE
jgi:hypothetical protein